VWSLESLYRDVRSDPKDDVTFDLKFWILSVKLMHHLVASRWSFNILFSLELNGNNETTPQIRRLHWLSTLHECTYVPQQGFYWLMQRTWWVRFVVSLVERKTVLGVLSLWWDMATRKQRMEYLI
jgi:hypothetical protein